MSKSAASEDTERSCEEDLLSLPSAETLEEAARWGVQLCAAAAEELPAGRIRPRRLPLIDAIPGAELGRVADKYALTALPQVDCEALIPLCRARCCTLTFALSPEDVAEGVIRWNPQRPYHIAHREDGYCVHLGDRGCTVYAERPATCRTYDCRADPRIWEDFDQRIPAGRSAAESAR